MKRNTVPPGASGHAGETGDPALRIHPGIRKVSTERLRRAEELREVCESRGVSVRQLARHWGVRPSHAHRLLIRDSGPPSEKIVLLPPTLRAAIGGKR